MPKPVKICHVIKTALNTVGQEQASMETIPNGENLDAETLIPASMDISEPNLVS
jgi:hypothetical protein